MWRYAKGRRRSLVLFVVLFLIANSLYLLEPFVIGQLLNAIQQTSVGPETSSTLLWLFLAMIGVSVGFWFFHGPARVLEQDIGFHIRAHFVDHLYRILMRLPIQWHRDHHSGQSINRMRKAQNALYDFSSNLFQLIEMLVRLIGSFIALFFLLPIAAIIASGASIAALLLVFVIDHWLLRMYEEINAKEHHTASAQHDYLTNIITVITLRLQKLTRNELWRRMTHYRELYHRSVYIGEIKWFLATVLISLMTVSVLAWYSLTTLRTEGVLLAGTFYMLYDYLQKVGGAFYTFAWKYSATIQQYADLLAASEILAAEPPEAAKAKRLPKEWKRIDIKNLHFRYEDEEKREHHLKDITVSLQRGKKIALVGESGSGKSTLMALLRGLFDPDRVEVSVDGEMQPQGLRHLADHVTLIPQEPEIFANTIEYNITVDTEQSRHEVTEDIRIAAFDTVLPRLRDGLKTNVVEKGVNLSGGEKQRLALARGVFAAKRSDIILLDEPTSSVDAVNERRIYRNLWQRFPDRAIVSSLHKLHLLPLFDEVYVLRDGRVIEHGPVKELLAQDGELKKLWEQYNREDREIT